ncbi:MAG: hypothetical protein AVDCRST_MAG70-746 [uncultured Thermomicrobiales bacterium]|uniref:Uncharacterized protein n=1 Tax=uncultured Thermomicrobiales bacterium TaxID=1645740 RepID=A0A6J4UEV2_9BACT|nr:MAG: hypothetical protein AVDCRST_MAG70-746 [uncultured Thermomicrobiales bacterium]
MRARVSLGREPNGHRRDRRGLRTVPTNEDYMNRLILIDRYELG